MIKAIRAFWGFGVLGFWGFGVLGFWGFGDMGNIGKGNIGINIKNNIKNNNIENNINNNNKMNINNNTKNKKNTITNSSQKNSDMIESLRSTIRRAESRSRSPLNRILVGIGSKKESPQCTGDSETPISNSGIEEIESLLLSAQNLKQKVRESKRIHQDRVHTWTRDLIRTENWEGRNVVSDVVANAATMSLGVGKGRFVSHAIQDFHTNINNMNNTGRRSDVTHSMVDRASYIVDSGGKLDHRLGIIITYIY